MRETAAALALLPETPMEAPPALWTRISETIASDRAGAATDAPGDRAVVELAARRALRPRWVAPALAAAAIVIVLLAVQVVSLRGQVDRAPRTGPAAHAAAFDRATGVEGARAAGLESGTGATVGRVVLLPDGTGYLRGDDLEPLPPEETYQLWARTGPEDAPVASAVLS